MKPGHLAALLLCLFLVSLSAPPAQAQFWPAPPSSGAVEQLRLGVLSYHRGRYAESIFLFEKALAFAPGDPGILYWLGRAYAKSGFEATALRTWEGLSALPESPAHLRARAEALRESRSIPRSEEGLSELVEVARFEGVLAGSRRFFRPSALLPRPAGGAWIVSHGTNQVVAMDANGRVVESLVGGLRGFDRPFGVAGLEGGRLVLSEFGSDRISLVGDGAPLVFGSSGRGPGQLLGPQQVAVDDFGYVYVCDYGNARVVKFDPEGAFILSLGAKGPDFPGLSSPTGLAVADGVVYVADGARRAVYRFDLSGNYLGALAEGRLQAPEGLFPRIGTGELLVADGTRILSLEPSTDGVKVLYRSPSRTAKILSAVEDVNGTILACDFDSSVVLVLMEGDELAGGYIVDIRRVEASRFPLVDLELTVSDRSGRPVLGLDQANFHLSERVTRTQSLEEGGKPVTRRVTSLEPAKEAMLVGRGNDSRGSRIMLLSDGSAAFAGREAVRALVDELSGLLASGEAPARLGLVSAGGSPRLSLALSPSPDRPTLLAALLERQAPEASGIENGIRLAAQALAPGETRDSIVYIGSGALPEGSFAGMGLSEAAALLRNNGLRFFAVLTGPAAPDEGIRYLCEESGGTYLSASRREGLSSLAVDLRSGPSGVYRFSFRSGADSGFGKEMLSVAAEAYLFKRSGRDEIGYFAPLR